MEILENHLRKNCDPRLPGILSLSIKEAYRFLDELVLREKVFQRQEMKQVWGYVRHGLVDVGLKQVFQSSNILHEIADKSSSRYPNGHTYLLVEVEGGILTPAKVNTPYAVPRNAVYRNRGSLLNKQYNLFTDPKDINTEYNENTPPFLLLTYGGKNHKLDFVKLGLPEVNEGKTKLSWIDQVDITNSPILLENPKQLVDELQLTFTSKAKEIMGRGAEKGEREDSV
ncbi:hypothetical protein IGJ63_001613 [Enterococcus sp. DIV1375a]|uniref:hypothetical protein n=1 Tax=Enterococcus sp. DIV1375a TaxID=2774755 RepID=UPI0019E8E674|nr:hypothetical protein [Enterococcus faecalis]